MLCDLSPSELSSVAEEIRRTVLDTVGKNGGHLAPNLGVVELTIALHRVFCSPRDQIVWDVSHQSYPHKLVTGRYMQFHTIRRHQGLSGYTDPGESVHDHFHWGHACTSISASVGLAQARDLKGEDFHVVAVIGDGAMTGGMAFEALNHAGYRQLKLIVVLNDNGMSISENVGALSHRLFQGGKDRSGDSVQFFSALGWAYIGPVDGHDIPPLQAALERAKTTSGPVVVHVVTTKGKGVPYAEDRPDKFHGCGPFDVSTGESKSGAATYSEIFSQTLARLAKVDNRVVAVTAAMPSGTGLSSLPEELHGRLFDVGIAEQHATTFAAGLAKNGMRPVFAVYSTFLQRGYDQVIHDVCLQNVPVVLAIDRAGLVEDGATHQGMFDIAYLRCLPNLVFGAPRDENELQHMLFTGIRHESGPFAFRYPRSSVEGVQMDEELHELPIGRGEVLRQGSDAAIFGLGVYAHVAMQAADELARLGIEARVINPRWIKPLDEALVIEAAQQCKVIVTVEEAVLAGGFGAAVAELLNDRALPVRLKRIGIPDRFVPHGKPIHYLNQFGLSKEGIVQAIRELVACQPVLVTG